MLINIEDNTVHSLTRLHTKPAVKGNLRTTLYRLFIRFNHWNSNRLAIRELQQLEDRMLKDIGLCRSGIEYAVNSNQGRQTASLDSTPSHEAERGQDREAQRHG